MRELFPPNTQWPCKQTIRKNIMQITSDSYLTNNSHFCLSFFINNLLFLTCVHQVKIWFQNKRYKCKKQTQESRRGIHPPPYEWPSIFHNQHQRHQVPVLVQPPSCPPHCYRPSPPSVNLNSPIPDSYAGYFPDSYTAPHYNNNVYSTSPYNQWPCYK